MDHVDPESLEKSGESEKNPQWVADPLTMLNFDALKQARTQARAVQDDADEVWLDKLHAAREAVQTFHRLDLTEKLQEATDSLLQIHAQKPSWAEPLAWLGYILFLHKQDRLAVQYLEAALSRDPEQALAHKVMSALKQGDPEPDDRDIPQIKSIRRLAPILAKESQQ